MQVLHLQEALGLLGKVKHTNVKAVKPVLYIINATMTSDCGITKCLPVFCLRQNVHSIIDEVQAEQIAQRIIDPFRCYYCKIVAIKVK